MCIEEEHSVRRSSPKVTVVFIVIVVVIIIKILVEIPFIIIIAVPIIVGIISPFFDIFCCTDCPSMVHDLSSDIIAWGFLIHLDNDISQGRNGSQTSIDQCECLSSDLRVVERVKLKLYVIRAVPVHPESFQIGAAVLDDRKGAGAILLNGDIAQFEVAETRKVDIDVSDTVCVIRADFLEEGRYTLRASRDKFEAIPVQDQSSFVADGLIDAENPG